MLYICHTDENGGSDKAIDQAARYRSIGKAAGEHLKVRRDIDRGTGFGGFTWQSLLLKRG